MSWSIWLEADVGRHGGAACLAESDWNYTSNMWRVTRLVMGSSPCALEGLSGEEAAELLEQAVCGLEVDEAICRELDPLNGWGNYDSFLEAMRRLLDLCAQHPRAIVAVCC